MNLDENQIILSFSKSLFDCDFNGVAEDLANVSLDTIFDDETLSCVPIVRTVIAVGKTVHSFCQKNAILQTLHFIEAFKSQKIPKEKIDRYRKRFSTNQKFREQELGRVLVLLEKNVDIEKSKILAYLYGGYINGEIDWNKFRELSDLNSRMFVSDIPLLFDINSGRVKDTSQCISYQVDRLVSLGLITSTPKTIYPGSVSEDRYVASTELGKIYCGLTKDIVKN